MTVLFTHPLCTDCHDVERDLVARDESLLSIEVKVRPDLAREYGISVVPTVLTVGADGAVTVAFD